MAPVSLSRKQICVMVTWKCDPSQNSPENCLLGLPAHSILFTEDLAFFLAKADFSACCLLSHWPSVCSRPANIHFIGSFIWLSFLKYFLIQNPAEAFNSLLYSPMFSESSCFEFIQVLPHKGHITQRSFASLFFLAPCPGPFYKWQCFSVFWALCKCSVILGLKFKWFLHYVLEKLKIENILPPWSFPIWFGREWKWLSLWEERLD